MQPRRFLVWSAAILAVFVCSPQGHGADLRVRDVRGEWVTPLSPARQANVLFFVATDCPVSNGYAPEIQRVCRDYASKGVSCSLVYEDVDTGAAPATLDAAVTAHLREYRYDGMTAVVDRTRLVASRTGATITPEALVVDRTGAIRYRGRIDNFYAALGRSRQHVTEFDLRNALDAVLAGRPVPRPRTQAIGCHITDPASLEKR